MRADCFGRTGGRVRGGARNAEERSAADITSVYFLDCYEAGEESSCGDRGERTRVVCSTFASLGKSLTPESSIKILEESRALVERRDETQEDNGFAIMDQFPVEEPAR